MPIKHGRQMLAGVCDKITVTIISASLPHKSGCSRKFERNLNDGYDIGLPSRN